MVDVDELRALGEEALAALLERRPDVLVAPEPVALSDLADRLNQPWTVVALRRLDRPASQVADVVALGGEAGDRAAVARLLGGGCEPTSRGQEGDGRRGAARLGRRATRCPRLSKDVHSTQTAPNGGILLLHTAPTRRRSQQTDGSTLLAGRCPSRETNAWSSVLGHREYASLWIAYAFSLAGDQLARVAVSVLVYARTGSALATASAYAVTFLPWALGGPLLGGLGDRYPRRTVLLVCDVLSALLVAVMALPGLGLAALLVLLFVVVLLAAPFTSARSSLVRDLFSDNDQYAAATALTTVTIQTSQVVGFAAGGFLVALVGSRPALLIDSVTFAVSAGLIFLFVRRRPAASAAKDRGSLWQDVVAGSRLVFGDPRLRVLTFFAWLAAFHSVPAGVVVPYVEGHGRGAATIGVLLAAGTLGCAISMVALTSRVPPLRRLRLLPPLALLASAGLVPCLLNPPLPVVALLWMLAGVGTGYQLAANVAFVSAVPAERRAQAFGLVSSGLAVGQGLGLIFAGALAEAIPPHVVVGLAGVAGTIVTLLLLAMPASRGALAVPG